VGVITVAQEHGSSLIEALVAALILSTGVVTMAQLLSIATATNLAARRSTVAVILAEQKLEELRATPWESLQPSSSSTLEENTEGYVDKVGIYTRRWSIEPLSSSPDRAVILQVLIFAPGPASVAAPVSPNRVRGAARIATVRGRME
jgi:hypothetical protein